MTHAPFRELMNAALDAPLTPSERDTLEDHLQTCASCRALWEAINEVDNLFRAAPVLPAPVHLAAWTSARLAARASRPRLIGGGLTLALAALAVAVGVGVPLIAGIVAIVAVLGQPGTIIALTRAAAAILDVIGTVVNGLWLVFHGLRDWSTGQPFFVAALVAILPLVGLWAYLFNRLSTRMVAV